VAVCLIRRYRAMAKHQFIRFQLGISAEQFLRVYQGSAKNISTRADDGRLIKFPAQNIKQFLTHDGIYGYFEMELTTEHKFVAIKKLNNLSTQA